jgi:ThiF family
MTYVFRPPTKSGRHGALSVAIVLVGCGGTGAFVAESICRLFVGRQASLYLVDPDRVETTNVARQAGLRGISAWYAGLQNIRSR